MSAHIAHRHPEVAGLIEEIFSSITENSPSNIELASHDLYVCVGILGYTVLVFEIIYRGALSGIIVMRLWSPRHQSEATSTKQTWGN